MALPLNYSLRNVFIRWRSTLATVLGVAAVVFVWVLMQSLAAGLEKAAASTGDPRNLLVVRKGSDSESTSQITLENLRAIQYAEEIARDPDGQPLVSADTLVVAYLERSSSVGGGANVIFRGISKMGPALRPQVRLADGRWFEPGKREATVSLRLAQRFAGMSTGNEIKLGARTLTVVGHFDAGGSAFDSEAWMDADEARSIFNRDNYASLLIRPTDASAGARLVKRLESDRRLVVRVVPEVAYYAEQTKTAGPIRWGGNLIATVMSIGAVLAAMNTMYASIGARTREIGTLRVLGFRRRSIVAAILIEGACLALIGGIIGGAVSLGLDGYRTGTFNFQTFSESVFELTITVPIVLKGLVFAAAVGVLGAFLPAMRASRMPVIMALKAT
ncbi:MAG: ABC transporter permease [Chthoniobacteraceae bacterium]